MNNDLFFSFSPLQGAAGIAFVMAILVILRKTNELKKNTLSPDAYIFHLKSHLGDMRENVGKNIEKLEEIRQNIEDLRREISNVETRLCTQMNSKFFRLEDRERDLSEKVILLESKQDFPPVKKRGRPPKNLVTSFKPGDFKGAE